MNKSVDNLKTMLGLRIGTYVLILLSALPGMLTGYEMKTIIPIIVAVIILLIIYILLKPSYYGIEFSGNDLFISTDKEGDNEFFLQMRKQELIDYKITGSWHKRRLLILKKASGQYMISKPLNIAVGASGNIAKIKSLLDPHVKQHAIQSFRD